MKTIKISLTFLIIAIMTACSGYSTKSASYEDVAKEADTAISKAKSMDYEWRDSRKILKKADKLNKAGKTEEALKLANKAKKQGELAIAQAGQQANVSGPH